jgi:hypothetical protein
MSQKKSVTTPGEAISVLIQVAQLAQSRGILTLDDAFLAKQSIDLLNAMANASTRMNEGPSMPGTHVPYDENQDISESAK